VDADMFHLRVIGRMIEMNEGQLRTDITENYINKQRQIINSSRCKRDLLGSEERAQLQQEI
jgi:hypothetical protein